MAQYRFMDIDNNNIVSIDCLQYCQIPKLKVLWLTDNLIKEIGWIY